MFGAAKLERPPRRLLACVTRRRLGLVRGSGQAATATKRQSLDRRNGRQSDARRRAEVPLAVVVVLPRWREARRQTRRVAPYLFITGKSESENKHKGAARKHNGFRVACSNRSHVFAAISAAILTFPASSAACLSVEKSAGRSRSLSVGRLV